jgi:hypothetical protein
MSSTALHRSNSTPYHSEPLARPAVGVGRPANRDDAAFADAYAHLRDLAEVVVLRPGPELGDAQRGASLDDRRDADKLQQIRAGADGRFHGTILDECWRPARRRRRFGSIRQLQAESAHS